MYRTYPDLIPAEEDSADRYQSSRVSEVSWYIPEFNSVSSSESRNNECDADRPKERVSVFQMGPTDQDRKSLRKTQIEKCKKALSPPVISAAPEELSFKSTHVTFRCRSPLRSSQKKLTGDVELTSCESVKIDTNAVVADTGGSKSSTY